MTTLVNLPALSAEELGELLACVEHRMKDVPTKDRSWLMLHSLRTACAEAKMAAERQDLYNQRHAEGILLPHLHEMVDGFALNNDCQACRVGQVEGPVYWKVEKC